MRCLLVLLMLALARGAAAQALEPAADKSSADIFLSGALTAAGNADTIYTWDIKFTYPKIEKRLGSSDHWFVASPTLEFVANKGTNANPDRIAVGGVGEVHFYTFGLFGRQIPNVVWSNVVTEEFDRDRVTRALAYQTAARLAFRTFSFRNASVAFVPRVEGGVEVGQNYENRLQSDGSGRVTRLYGGATVYQELGVPWLTLSFAYQVRRPLQEEIFLRKHGDGRVELRLTKETRHYVEVAPLFKVGKWFSLKPTYKHGSLPPAFNYVDGEFSLSLLFSAKAVSNR